MSHFTISVIFPSDEPKEEIKKLIENNKNGVINVLSKKIEKPLSHYDINKRVDPYKDYIEIEEIEKMANYYNIKASNLESIKNKLIDWRGEDDATTGIDEKGLFIMSRMNKKGKFDSWGAYDVYLIDDLLNKDDFTSHAIFTPNCELVESDTWFYHIDKSNRDNFEKWNKKFRETLKKYTPNAFVLLVDCHI